MSKQRLIVTILIFILTLALVVGASYLLSLFLGGSNRSRSLADRVVSEKSTINLTTKNDLTIDF